MQGDEAGSDVEFKGSFYSDMIIRYLNVRPLLRSVEFSKGLCHLLILEERLVETVSIVIQENAYK